MTGVRETEPTPGLSQHPAEWLPPRSAYRCTYLGDWLAVKVRWSLSVDPAERAAIQS